jgi:hypothetical protein
MVPQFHLPAQFADCDFPDRIQTTTASCAFVQRRQARTPIRRMYRLSRLCHRFPRCPSCHKSQQCRNSRYYHPSHPSRWFRPSHPTQPAQRPTQAIRQSAGRHQARHSASAGSRGTVHRAPVARWGGRAGRPAPSCSLLPHLRLVMVVLLALPLGLRLGPPLDRRCGPLRAAQLRSSSPSSDRAGRGRARPARARVRVQPLGPARCRVRSRVRGSSSSRGPAHRTRPRPRRLRLRKHPKHQRRPKLHSSPKTRAWAARRRQVLLRAVSCAGARRCPSPWPATCRRLSTALSAAAAAAVAATATAVAVSAQARSLDLRRPWPSRPRPPSRRSRLRPCSLSGTRCSLLSAHLVPQDSPRPNRITTPAHAPSVPLRARLGPRRLFPPRARRRSTLLWRLCPLLLRGALSLLLRLTLRRTRRLVLPLLRPP